MDQPTGPDEVDPAPEGQPAGTHAASDPAEPVAFSDPAYRAAVVDLLGAIAYGELSAFERLVEDTKLAPDLADRIELGAMAATQFGHVQPLLDRIAELGADPIAAMQPFAEAFESFHASTAPSDWLEGLVKAYVGDGLAADFYREITTFVDAGTRELILDSLQDAGQAGFVVGRVGRAIEQDPRVGGRLALWGRRLMGEALAQGQRVIAERDSLAAMLAGGVDRPGMDLAALTRMFSRLTENHAKRMSELGLAA